MFSLKVIDGRKYLKREELQLKIKELQDLIENTTDAELRMDYRDKIVIIRRELHKRRYLGKSMLCSDIYTDLIPFKEPTSGLPGARLG